MAYLGELAKNRGIQSLTSDPAIKEVLKEIEFISSVSEYKRIDQYIVNNFTKAKDSKLENIFVIDGSKYDSKLGENNEINVALISIDQCVINMPKMVAYLKNSFALPKDYQAMKEDISINMILPLKGLKTREIADEKDFFRMFFYKVMQAENKIFEWIKDRLPAASYHESLLDTYLNLLTPIKKLNANIPVPCPYCRKAGHMLSLKTFKNIDGSWNPITQCKCDTNPVNYYITDLLQFTELLNNENSNEALTTQMMLVLERITLVNLLNNLVGNNAKEILENSAFVMDGSLAIYSHASWLSSAIGERIYDLKNDYQLLICGVEKTGNFVEHFKKVDHYYQDQPLAKGTLYFLEDDYIKKYIKVYHNDSFYGEKNYFGKKLFYKNRLNKLFVINLAFENEADKYLDYNNRNGDQQRQLCQRMEDLIMLLENFSSQAYPNALSFISMANEGASLSSSSMGKKILNEFIDGLLLLKK